MNTIPIELKQANEFVERLHRHHKPVHRDKLRIGCEVDSKKMMLDGESIMRNAIETYGVQAQCDVAVEEMAELTKAIMKIRRVANDYEKTQPALDNLLEEIADVDIMIDQLKIMWGPKPVEEYRRKKIERLERRLNDDRS